MPHRNCGLTSGQSGHPDPAGHYSISWPVCCLFSGTADMGNALGGAKASALTTADWIFIRTVLAIHVTVTRPPLGDAVPVVTLEVGGLTGVIDGCQRKRREKWSRRPSHPCSHHHQGPSGEKACTRSQVWPGAALKVERSLLNGQQLEALSLSVLQAQIYTLKKSVTFTTTYEVRSIPPFTDEKQA